jgi:DNA polymerase III alpha subunit (gram-positive type)
MKLLIIDTETTGLSEEDAPIEVAGIFYLVGQGIISQVSTIVSSVIPNFAVQINKIQQELIDIGTNNQIITVLNDMANECDYVLAHNAQFDKQACAKIPGLNIHQKWVDSQYINFPNSQYCKTNGLHNLAIAHNVPVIDTHRALDDCRLLSKLLDTVANLEQEILLAAEPRVLVKSLEPYPATLTKQAGFRWNANTKTWAKHIKEKEIVDLPFQVKIIGTDIND